MTSPSRCAAAFPLARPCHAGSRPDSGFRMVWLLCALSGLISSLGCTRNQSGAQHAAGTFEFVGEVRRSPNEPEMVRIPPGEFRMGSNDLGPAERPVHRVYLSDYYIGRF